MKTNRLFAIALVLSSFAVAQAEDTYTLRRIFTVGEADTYKMASSSDTNLEIPGQGAQAMKFEQSNKVTYTTKKFDKEKGEAQVEIKFFEVEAKMDGPMPMGDMPKEYSVMATFDGRNRMKDMVITGLPGMMRMTSESSMRQMLGGMQYPEAAVKVGDSWDVKFEKDKMMFATDQILKAKLISVKDIDGKKIGEISVKGPMEIAVDVSKLMEEAGGGADNPMAGMKMNMGGKIQNDTVLTIDMATGKIISMDTNATSDLNMEMVDMGMKIPLSSTVKSIMKLDTKAK